MSSQIDLRLDNVPHLAVNFLAATYAGIPVIKDD